MRTPASPPSFLGTSLLSLIPLLQLSVSASPLSSPSPQVGLELQELACDGLRRERSRRATTLHSAGPRRRPRGRLRRRAPFFHNAEAEQGPAGRRSLDPASAEQGPTGRRSLDPASAEQGPTGRRSLDPASVGSIRGGAPSISPVQARIRRVRAAARRKPQEGGKGPPLLRLLVVGRVGLTLNGGGDVTTATARSRTGLGAAASAGFLTSGIGTTTSPFLHSPPQRRAHRHGRRGRSPPGGSQRPLKMSEGLVVSAGSLDILGESFFSLLCS
jgi:hypothetical protein